MFENYVCHHSFKLSKELSYYNFFTRFWAISSCINQNQIVNICNDKSIFEIYTFHYFFRSEFYDLCMGEKLGTHINAPSTFQHYRNKSWSVDQIPIEFLVNRKLIREPLGMVFRKGGL